MQRLVCLCTLLLSLLAFLVPTFAQEKKEDKSQEKSDRLTAMDVFNLQFAADTQISPDGRRIVYVRQFSDIMNDKRESNLWVISADGSEDRGLTNGNFSDNSPRWSPDGTRIAYLSDRDGKPQIYVRWMDNGQIAQLTNLDNAPSDIVWSPDGKLISFTAFVPSEPPKIANLPKAPEGAKWADPPKVYDRLVYRFNGRGYLKYGFMQRFVVSSEGGAPRQLTSGNLPYGGSEGVGGGSRAAWTPDGKYLIFSANLHPEYEYEPLNSEVYELSLADGTGKPLTTRKGPDSSPAVSPDGKTIAYVGFDDRYQGHQTTHLYLMNRDGSNARVATPQFDRDVESPQWAQDGSGVYFLYDDQGDTKLAFYALDGKVKDLTNHIGSGGSSYAGGAGFTVAKDGTFAVPYDTPTDAGDIAVGSRANPKARVLTALNQQLFTQKKLGQTEEFWFESSVD